MNKAKHKKMLQIIRGRKLILTIVTPIILIILVSLCCCATFARWFNPFRPPWPCFTDAKPGDNIYPLAAAQVFPSNSDIALASIKLPDSTEHFGAECIVWQGILTFMWFEMQTDEFGDWLATLPVETPLKPAEHLPSFGPKRWERGNPVYHYGEYEGPCDETPCGLRLWVSESGPDVLRVYIMLFCGD